MTDKPDLVPGQRVRLSTHINDLVRFKLHELADMKEGVIRAIDQHGYWIEGGSLAAYLRSTSPGADADSAVQFIEFELIHWIQRGAAPNAAYDLTITETDNGIEVTGSATLYPSVEVWQYSDSGGPNLVYSHQSGLGPYLGPPSLILPKFPLP